MFCPKCATQNVDGASFCRSCGANISLIPHALSGQLPVAQADNDLDRWSRRRRRRYGKDEPASLERGIVNLFMGVGFLIAALAVMFKFPGGFTWGWAFFIPGFSCLGKGVAMIVSARRKDSQQMESTAASTKTLPAQPDRVETLPSFKTGRLAPAVPSVTEGTTRHLGAEAPTRNFDSMDSGEKPS
jgi:hypothetical protein